MRSIPWLPPDDDAPFPPLETALRHPNGLLAAGGSLSAQRLLNAYRLGVFPWYSEGQAILWWSPDPRMVLFPAEFHLQRRAARKMRSGRFRFTADRDFSGVVAGCAAPRRGEPGTWITSDMVTAYTRLHELGHAHSIEVWQADHLVGGVYGVGMGGVFFGESMFSRVSDASKMALACLCRHIGDRPGAMIDCQVHSRHLETLGARLIPRSRFVEHLKTHARPAAEAWTLDSG